MLGYNSVPSIHGFMAWRMLNEKETDIEESNQRLVHSESSFV